MRETTAIAPQNIVPVHEKFDLVAKLQGDGPGRDVFMSGETAVVVFHLQPGLYRVLADVRGEPLGRRAVGRVGLLHVI